MDQDILLEKQKINDEAIKLYQSIICDIKGFFNKYENLSEFIYLQKMIYHYHKKTPNKPYDLMVFEIETLSYKEIEFLYNESFININNFFANKGLKIYNNKLSFAWIENYYKKENISYYDRPSFQNLHSELVNLNAQIKNTIKFYSLIDNVCKEGDNISNKNIDEFIEDFKKDSNLFYMLLTIIGCINENVGFRFLKRTIKAQIDMTDKGLEDFYKDIKNLYGYVPDMQIKNKIFEQAKKMKIIEKLKLEDKLQNELNSKNVSINVVKHKI